MIDVVEGMKILMKYFDDPEYQTAAEHDIIYVYPTDRPIDNNDLVKLCELGWFQEDAEYSESGNFTPDCYDPQYGWGIFT